MTTTLRATRAGQFPIQAWDWVRRTKVQIPGEGILNECVGRVIVVESVRENGDVQGFVLPDDRFTTREHDGEPIEIRSEMLTADFFEVFALS